MEQKQLIPLVMHSGWPVFMEYVDELIATHEARLHSHRGAKSTEQKMIEDEATRSVIEDLKKIQNLKEDIFRPKVPVDKTHLLWGQGE